MSRKDIHRELIDFLNFDSTAYEKQRAINNLYTGGALRWKTGKVHHRGTQVGWIDPIKIKAALKKFGRG